MFLPFLLYPKFNLAKMGLSLLQRRLFRKRSRVPFNNIKYKVILGHSEIQFNKYLCGAYLYQAPYGRGALREVGGEGGWAQSHRIGQAAFRRGSDLS